MDYKSEIIKLLKTIDDIEKLELIYRLVLLYSKKG